MASAATLSVRDVVDRNPISWFQYRALALCFLCIVVDGLEVTVVSFLPKALKADWGVGTAQLAPAMTAGLIGLGVGALVGGPLGDRIGRRRVISWAVGCFTVTTLVTAASDGVLTFSVLRLLTGISLGASMPNVAALVSEIVPTNRRRSIVALVWSGFPTGAAIGAATMPLIVDAFDWQAAILVSGIVAGAVFVFIGLFLPESPMYLADTGRDTSQLVKFCNAVEPGSAGQQCRFARGTTAGAKSYPLGALLARNRRIGTLTLWVGYMAVMFAIYLTSTWLPYLFSEADFTAGSISALTTALQIGGAVGCAAIGFIQDRFGPHRTLVLASTLCAVAALTLATFPRATTVLAVLVFTLGMCTNAISTGYTAISTTFYPTAIRSTGTSWTAGMSRIGAVLGAGAGASLASVGISLQQVFLLLLVPISTGGVCMAIKGLAGRSNAELPDLPGTVGCRTTAAADPTSITREGV
ncbi:MFS transporter [Mycolicibacterium goodii]|uniref:MFS transporter n=1 Tax=Mycolicibacterium goodii TaxID=134601 RepID=UPI001BDC3044|nr:MFS transporter [Mycolicibacterium goodii]MBU8828962.1 aromatic acid/H+ symport family MFS transporter [Mycolicibacterium goodii]